MPGFGRELTCGEKKQQEEGRDRARERDRERERERETERELKALWSKRVGDAKAKEITSCGPSRHSRMLASRSYWTASSIACGQSSLIFVRKALCVFVLKSCLQAQFCPYAFEYLRQWFKNELRNSPKDDIAPLLLAMVRVKDAAAVEEFTNFLSSCSHVSEFSFKDISALMKEPSRPWLLRCFESNAPYSPKIQADVCRHSKRTSRIRLQGRSKCGMPLNLEFTGRQT